MKQFLIIILFLSLTINAIGQKALNDSVGEKEPIAIAGLGGAASSDIKSGRSSFGYNISVEFTPIENWLELEIGVTPTFGAHLREQDIDILFKKPWTLSPKVEFMFGLGLAWNHTSSYSVTTNSVGGELALDFMFWPSAKRRFGWFLEPAYEYGFGQGHEQSVGISGGLLVAIR
ncbi:MAG TPA: hypothetical protein VNW95_17615 [Mucilaginibacter sp.]|nr:hypothetical protein [Mucilaginibacter sp.]